MMNLTYIFHSGFVLETERCVLVFDYWMDPAGVMPGVLASAKPMYVFSSHFHEDHFTRKIFDWQEGKDKITYILSKDILKRRRASQDEAQVWLSKGGTWQDENIRVTATGSNDSGVSWIVEVENRRIFHAGDLCNWYARFLSETPISEMHFVMSGFESAWRMEPFCQEKQIPFWCIRKEGEMIEI